MTNSQTAAEAAPTIINWMKLMTKASNETRTTCPQCQPLAERSMMHPTKDTIGSAKQLKTR